MTNTTDSIVDCPDIVVPNLSITLRLVPTYVDIPSDPGVTHQHNSLAHNIKL